MPLLIPIPPVQELSTEELEPLKGALLAHLRSTSAASRDMVDRNLHVTKGERIPAYSFTLHSLLESRDPTLKTVVKPSPPGSAKAISPPGESWPEVAKDSEDIWSFPSEDRDDFVPHADSYFLPGSLKEDDCRDCYQKGELGCKACLGKGAESCPDCLGAGRQSCFFCKGTEKISCLRCGGEGRLSSGGVGGRSASCDACGSKGKFPCSHCKEGKISCDHCRGEGRVPCKKCQGQGKVVCPSCEGHKKILSGKAFHATFKPSQLRSFSLAERGPKEALEMALEKKIEVGSLGLSTTEDLEKQVKEAVVPASVRAALEELVKREKSQRSPGGRTVKRRLDLAEGSVVRIRGFCAGQEFSYWISPETKRIVAEKDPLAAFGSSAVSSAENARKAGDWKKALALARECLSYSPNHPGARALLRDWRWKVGAETFLGGFLGGAIAAAVQVTWIVYFVKGLHKGGEIVHSGGKCLALGPLGALVLFPFLLRLPRFALRATLLSSGLLVVYLLNAIAGRWASDPNPILTADRTALEEELKDHFKYGFPQVYFEPDLVFLRSLIEKYKGTDVDMKRLHDAVDSQLKFRSALARQQGEFEAQVGAILESTVSADKKRARLEKLSHQYRVMGVDLKPSEAAMEKLEESPSPATGRARSQSSRINIVSPEKIKKAPTLLQVKPAPPQRNRATKKKSRTEAPPSGIKNPGARKLEDTPPSPSKRWWE